MCALYNFFLSITVFCPFLLFVFSVVERMFNTEHLCSACVFSYIKKITTRKWSILWCMNMFSLNPPWQEASVHPDGPEFWEKPEPLLYFTAPKGSWEQNVGDRPQQVVHTCRGEGRAEHHDDSWGKKRKN